MVVDRPYDITAVYIQISEIFNLSWFLEAAFRNRLKKEDNEN